MSQLLQNALYGTVMILVVAVLRRALRDRLVPGARLALWAVCLFRLLTPAAPKSVLSLWGLSRLFAPERQAAPAPAPIPQPYVLPQGVPAPRPDPGVPWETVLLAAWLAAGAVLAMRYVLSWTRTRRAVACAIPLDRDDPRYAALPKCARLREGPMEGAPLTFGALRPTVVLSPGLDGEALDCVLAHEGVHAARRDNLWHYAMALALVVHWWNPAVWLMSRLLRRDIELSCDRAALKRLGEDRRADYAQALVSLATQGSGPAFCQTFGRKAAEERILSIMKFKKTSIIGVIFTLSLVLAVTVTFASEPKQPDEYDSVKVNTSLSLNEKTSADYLAGLPDKVQDLYVGMPQDKVHALLGEPSFSSSRPFSDTYELDPDSPKRQLGIYYDVAGAVTQVKYFSDGTDTSAAGVDLAPYLASTALSSRIVSVPDIEATKGIQSDFTEVEPDDVDLSLIKEKYAQMAADGKLTQEEADAAMAAAEDMLEQARRGERKLFMTGDGWVYGMGVSTMYYKDENGDLHPISPDTTDSGYVLDSRDVSDYNVELPIFDEDGNSVSADGGIVGRVDSRIYGYELVTGSDAASGGLVGSAEAGDAIPVPTAAPAKDFDNYTITGMDENGYPLDEQGRRLVFDESGNLFMKVSAGYGPCIKEDCAISEAHYHRDGEVVPMPKSNAPTPAFAPEVGTAPMRAPYCPVCTETSLHVHLDGRVVLLSDPCAVEGCTITGNHIHGDVCYSCNGAGHADGHCDGSCYTYFTSTQSVNTSTHHSESHHKGGHH